VASTSSRFTRIRRASAEKRASEARTVSTASGERLPVSATPAPRPASTFSLNSGVGERARRS
jgi:hypothetical protein